MLKKFIKNMKSLKEHLNESRNSKIYVVVKGESNEGIYELMSAFTSEREANKFIKEHEKDVSGVDYLEVIEVDLYDKFIIM